MLLCTTSFTPATVKRICHRNTAHAIVVYIAPSYGNIDSLEIYTVSVIFHCNSSVRVIRTFLLLRATSITPSTVKRICHRNTAYATVVYTACSYGNFHHLNFMQQVLIFSLQQLSKGHLNIHAVPYNVHYTSHN